MEVCFRKITDFLETFISLDSIVTIINSNFSTALFGSLMGAFAGAYTAQYIARRNELNERYSEEIRNINAAITLTYSIFNIFAQLKLQYVSEMYSNYKVDYENYTSVQNEIVSGTDIPYHIKIDGRTLAPLNLLVIDNIKDLVFSKISSVGRAICLVSTLSHTIDTLNDAIKKRNELVADFRTKNYSNKELLDQYFGLNNDSGHINQIYPDTLKIINDFTDDGIFFSYLLCSDLQEHGEKVLKKYTDEFDTKQLIVNKIDFDLSIESGLIPKKDNYSTWFTSFKTKDS